MYLVEVIQVFLIQLHIKPTKVPTKKVISAKNFFEKMFLRSKITAQSFRNWSKKLSQSMSKVQKFLREVDGYKTNDFLAF